MSSAVPSSDVDILRLQQDVQRYRKEAEALSRLHALAMRLAQTPETRDALLAVLEVAVEAQGAQFGLLSLYDEREGFLHVWASIGFDADALAQLAQLIPGPTAGACGRSFFTRQRVIVADTEADPLFASYVHLARAVGFRAVHSTPILTRGGEIRGVLSVHFSEPRTPGERERVLADLCARHAAEVLDTARGQRALLNTERRSRFLVELDDLLRPLSAPEEIAVNAARALGRHLDASRCAYATVEDDQKTFQLTGDFNDRVKTVAGSYPFRQFGPECLRLMRAGQPYAVHDIESDGRIERGDRQSYVAANIRAFVWVPILKSGSLVAAMAVHAAEPRVWSEEDIALVQQVAGRCWEAIERARVTQHLAEREHQFRQLANSIANLAWMARPDGWIYWFNDQWYAYTGTTPEDMEGWGWESVHDPERLPEVKARWQHSIANGTPFEMVFPLRGADGVFRRFLTRVNPVLDSQGRVRHWFGTNTDVEDERRAAEVNAELRERERLAREDAELQKQLLYSLFMQAPTLIAVLRGPQHVIELANPPVCAVWGRPAEELVGRPLMDALPELRGQVFQSLLDEVYRTGNPYTGKETPARLARDGGTLETVYFNFVYSPFRDVRGTIQGIFVIASDVTDQVMARAQVTELKEAAESANRAKDEFLAMLGHELRNPLSPIVTALQLMKLRGNDASERERQVIERQVSHLTRLVDDLLDVSRIARGIVDLKEEIVELAEVVEPAIEMVSPLLEQRSHTLALVLPRDGLTVRGDRTRLSQVVSNLLTNAAKYTPPGGRITVRASVEQAVVVLRVADTGIGIAPDVLPRVFDLFVQGGQGIDRSQGGLGLGLTITRKLIERHGGTVTAYSAGAGMGSEFVVRLPKVDPPPCGATDHRSSVTREPSATNAAHRLRILVVDDNRDGAEMLAVALETMGFEVRTAADGPEALRIAEEFRPAIAFLDIGLPVLDGYELAERIRRVPHLQGIRLIALTGYGQESDRRKSAAAGFHHHLVKPVDVHLIEAMLRGPASRA